WSVPKMLRLHFLHHRKLLPMLCRCAWDVLTMFLHKAIDRRDVYPGGILVPQAFEGMANWNPHVNALITDTCWDREGNYYPMPEIDTADVHGIEKLFTELVSGRQPLHPSKLFKKGVYFHTVRVVYLAVRTPLEHHALPLILLWTVRHVAVEVRPVKLPAGHLISEGRALCISCICAPERALLFDVPAVLHYKFYLE
ncbi:MAG: hypothetical protein K8S24_00310, partial [Candidatus Aegiribacteria sp.]|nr:hypothetical protein [Candidatus Aegiribacteria sp.]